MNAVWEMLTRTARRRFWVFIFPSVVTLISLCGYMVVIVIDAFETARRLQD